MMDAAPVTIATRPAIPSSSTSVCDASSIAAPPTKIATGSHRWCRMHPLKMADELNTSEHDRNNHSARGPSNGSPTTGRIPTMSGVAMQ